MKKYLILAVVVLLFLSVVVMAAGIKFSVLTFYTTDLQSGAYDVWPIAYFNVPLTNSIGLRFEDYVMATHKTFNLGNFPFMSPTYWYLTYRNGFVNGYLGHFKSKHTLTRQMYLLRVGGFYDSLTGVELDFRNFTYDFGARFDLANYVFGAYAGVKTNKTKMYVYTAQDGRYKNEWHLSTNMEYESTLGSFYFKGWGAAAYDVDTTAFSFGMPTFLIGGEFSWRNFDLKAQFAKQPSSSAAKIWYDYNDPNKSGYPLMDFNSLLTYKLDMQNSIGIIANWNSNLSYPMFGMKFSHGDMSLTIGSGDVDGGISGTQYVTLSYSNYFSVPITTHPLFSSGERNW